MLSLMPTFICHQGSQSQPNDTATRGALFRICEDPKDQGHVLLFCKQAGILAPHQAPLLLQMLLLQLLQTVSLQLLLLKLVFLMVMQFPTNRCQCLHHLHSPEHVIHGTQAGPVANVQLMSCHPSATATAFETLEFATLLVCVAFGTSATTVPLPPSNRASHGCRQARGPHG